MFYPHLPYLKQAIFFLPVVFANIGLSGPVTLSDVTSSLGPDFFVDQVSAGGGKNSSTVFNRDFSGAWEAGSQVVISGLGWASPSSNSLATSLTVTVTDLGPDGVFGTNDDTVVGTITDTFQFAGVGEYAWKFDSPVTFLSNSNGIRISIAANGSIHRKTVSSDATSQDAVKLSIAGFAEESPAALSYAASNSGFWDLIDWNSKQGQITGDLGLTDIATIGQGRKVTYRGLPALEKISGLSLGETPADFGQGWLKVTSGLLTISGQLFVGQNFSGNDGFIEVAGGVFKVEGAAHFGRTTQHADGSLIVTGGKVLITGDANMGDHSVAGSMIRFHNPGASPVAEIGGTLRLERCSVNFTFDSEYTHVPGNKITLISYSEREGQFKNFRHGDQFSSGPNRFLIEYDVPFAGEKTITLTALPNFESQNDNPPNLIFILSDDQGYADNPVNGHSTWASKFPMPNLKSIAENGVTFTSGYVTGGVCHPSRCGILTGIYQQRIGVDNNSDQGLSVASRTVPRRLQAIQYKTYGIGKWHLGETVEYHPNNRGFDYWYGMAAGSRAYYFQDPKDEIRIFQNQLTMDFAGEDGTYLTDRCGDAAVNFIDRHVVTHPDKPFYMYLSFTAPHTPIDIDLSDPRFARLNSEFNLTAQDYADSPDLDSPEYPDPKSSQQKRYELAAMLLAMDENIGKVMGKLTSEGLLDNTMIVYMSDNGGTSSVKNYSINPPLRKSKGGSSYEGSFRVPCVAQWPAQIPRGQVISTPVNSLDFMATFVNAVQPPPQARNGLDGIDLLPLMRDGVPLPSERVLTFRGGGHVAGGTAIRKGDWKLIIDDDLTNPEVLLFNVDDSPGEYSDLSGGNPTLVAELMDRLNAWESRTISTFVNNGAVNADTDLDYYAIVGGYRLKSSANGPRYLSSTIRFPNDSSSDWQYSFFARSTELTDGPDAKLVYGLGDSETRGQLLQFIMNFEDNSISIVDGKSGVTSTQSAQNLPKREWQKAIISFDSANQTLTFATGGNEVSVVLGGNYGPLKYFATGVAAMEGELTTLRNSEANKKQMNVDLANGKLLMTYDFSNSPPLNPIPESSIDLRNFSDDPDMLVEALGGGLYRFSTQIGDDRRRFFRMKLR